MGIFDSFLKNYREANPMADHIATPRKPSSVAGPDTEHLDSRDAAARRGDAPRGSRSYNGSDGTVEDEGNPVDQGYDHDDEATAFGPGGDVIDSNDPAYANSPRTHAMTGEGNPAMEQPLDQKVSRVRIECPHCDQPNTVRLPSHLRLARTARTSEGGNGKLLRTKCGHCDETVRFRAPEGFAFAKRASEAQRTFIDKYLYLSGRGGNPKTRYIRNAMESFRKSYWGR